MVYSEVMAGHRPAPAKNQFQGNKVNFMENSVFCGINFYFLMLYSTTVNSPSPFLYLVRLFIPVQEKKAKTNFIGPGAQILYYQL